jgi:hypothetical protein
VDALSERDKVAAWAVAIALMIAGYLWLGTQPPTDAVGPCVTQGHDYVCE